MKAPAILTSSLLLLTLSLGAVPITGKHTFTVGDQSFMLDGKPFVIRCGEMHFARIPRAYWHQRLQMVKACGFNAVCAYMFWNYHEPVRGRYEFTGEKDVAAFCKAAQEEGLWVVLRPGPYTCAEWEFGGLPWWLMKNRDIKLRTSDPRYLKPACEFLAQAAKQLVNNQITRGGNILMVQVENEYGFWGDDKNYIRQQYEAIRSSGFDVPAFCCNNVPNIRRGVIPELLPVVNFGGNPQHAFEQLRKFRPKGPLMCGEYYPAWFDSWGEAHNTKGAAQCLKDLEYMLQQKASFSVYMAHGGTSFGWWAGCNAPFRPQTSSYDYDAPVSEAGLKHPTKFESMKGLFARYLNPGEKIPEAPLAPTFQSAVCSATPTKASMWNVASAVKKSVDPLTFEDADLGYGYAVYRTTIPAGKGGELKADVRDLGVVRVDGRDVGFLDRRFKKGSVRIPVSDRERKLEILVEQMGRYNFAWIMHESNKGIIGKVTLGGAVLNGWTMACINLNEDREGGLASLGAFGKAGTKAESGAVYKYVVNLKAQDTYLDMHDWKRGQVRVNGHWIGRYWSIGPTQTMYVPGCWLKDGENEIVIIDVVGVRPAKSLKFVETPVLGEMRPETDYFAFQPRAKLAGKLSNPVKEGEFGNTVSRQEVRFSKSVKGRYFALETLDAWDGQPFAAGGEIDLIDAAGRDIPHSKWTIAACDSEERKAEDGSAENLIDGQTANLWHTEWKSAKPNHPHYFVIDLGQEENVKGFNFMPRQSEGGGRIRHYRAYVLQSVKLAGAAGVDEGTIDVLPYPREVKVKDGTVTVKSLDDIAVKKLPSGKLKPEGYAIRIGKKGVEVWANDAAGTFYARETLKQLSTKTESGFELPCCSIKDWPEYSWRGVLFDDCRHFFGKDAVKRTMDAMAAHKMNVFHWHLTEDQAWRLAIPKYPELVKIGAVRSQSEYSDGLGKNRALDGRQYGPFFYTEDDVKEILAYAKARHIRVIPEIELPGHAVAAVAAYPNLCCRGKLEPREPRLIWGVSDDIFCAGNDETIKFLENVLDYVTGLFPDEVVHIGGDEAPKGRWKECPKCQARMKAESISDVGQLQGWMTAHFTKYLQKKGKRAIGWDEVMDAKIPSDTMIMCWRGAKGGIAAAKEGHDVVMCPTSHCYLDYPQGDAAMHAAKGYGYPTWSKRTTLQESYSLDPRGGIPEEFQKHIIGVQGNMWSESIVTPDELSWKLWPRGAALAEVAWSGANARPWSDFKRRCDVDMMRMEEAGYNVCK